MVGDSSLCTCFIKQSFEKQTKHYLYIKQYRQILSFNIIICHISEMQGRMFPLLFLQPVVTIYNYVLGYMYGTSCHVSCHVMSCYVTLRQVMLHFILLYVWYVTLRYLVCYVTLRYLVCYVMLCYVTLYHVTFRYVTSRHVTSHYFWSCYITLNISLFLERYRIWEHQMIQWACSKYKVNAGTVYTVHLVY